MNSVVHLRRLAFLSMVAAAAFSGYYWWKLSEAHQRLRADTYANASKRALQLADAQSDHFEALLRGVDLALQQFRDAYQSGGRAAAEASALTSLNVFPKGSLMQFFAVDVNGNVSYSTKDMTDKGYVGDRDYFRFHQRSNDDRLFINKPESATGTGDWVIPVSRRILQNRRVAGVAVVLLAPEYLSATLARLVVDLGDVTSLLYDDGTYLARSQIWQEVIGKSIPANRPLLGASGAARGVYRGVADADTDKVNRIFGWTRLEGYPLVIRFGLDEREIFASVDRDIEYSRMRNAVSIGILFAVIGVAATLLIRAARQREAKERSEAMLRSTLDSTEEGILVVDSDGNIVNANHRFYELWRIPKEIVGTGQDDVLLTHLLDQLSDPGAFVHGVMELHRTRVARTDTLRLKDGRVFERYMRTFVHGSERPRLWSFRDISNRV